MLHWKSEGTKIYQQLAADMLESFKPCEPLRNEEEQELQDILDYMPWKKDSDEKIDNSGKK